MAITVNHQFVSAKGDGSDATLVRPSNWNASHNINMATNRVIGRLTAGPGLAEELPVTSYMMNLLNTADYAALAVLLGLPTTGDAKLTFKATADSGWILADDGTIGDAGSGSTRANVDTLALFTFFYNTFADAVCPVLTSAGGATTRVAQGTAANAFSTAKCRMVIPKTLGRSLIIAGTGSGLSARPLATTGGAETHTLSANESVAHTHAFSTTLTSTSVSGTPTGSTSTTLSGSTGFRDTNHVHNTDPANIGTNSANTQGYSLSHSHGSVGVPNIWTSGGYVNAGYVGLNYSEYGTSAAASPPDHLHAVDIPSTGSGIELGGAYGDGSHKHPLTGTFAGTCSVSTWTGVTVAGTAAGTTGAAQSVATPNFNGAAHNNMQPWTAWNVMIRL